MSPENERRPGQGAASTSPSGAQSTNDSAIVVLAGAALNGHSDTSNDFVSSVRASRPVVAALALAGRGWHVFPIHAPRPPSPCSCGATDCERPAKHPRTKNGLKDATTNPDQIGRWFTRWPVANLGVRTGVESGIVVLDVDPRHGGDKTLAALESKCVHLPDTVMAETGGGGRHYFFQHPACEVRNSESKIGPGLDVRGDGGYVVVAPSIHTSGSAYRWVVGHAPGEVDLAPVPGWLLELMRRDTGASSLFATTIKDDGGKQDARLAAPTFSVMPEGGEAEALQMRALAYVDVVPGVQEGQRNGAAFALSGQLRAFVGSHGERLSEPYLFGLMSAWNERCQPPLDEGELRTCIANSATNGRLPADKPPRPLVGFSSSGETAAKPSPGSAARIEGAAQVHQASERTSTKGKAIAIGDALGARVQALIRDDAHCRKLFVANRKPYVSNEAAPDEQPRSDDDMAFAAVLVKKGIIDSSELATALWFRPDGNAREKGEKYIARTIASAFAAAGIGTGPAQDTSQIHFDKVRIWTSRPPTFEFTVGDTVFTAKAVDLGTAAKFSNVCLQALFQLPALPRKTEAWKAWLNSLLAGAERLEMPPEASDEIALREEIERAIEALPESEDVGDLDHGKAIYADGIRGFKTQAIVRRIQENFPKAERHDICRVLKALGFTWKTPRIGGTAVRIWTKVSNSGNGENARAGKTA